LECDSSCGFSADPASEQPVINACLRASSEDWEDVKNNSGLRCVPVSPLISSAKAWEILSTAVSHMKLPIFVLEISGDRLAQGVIVNR
jgi:hypothetical protein